MIMPRKKNCLDAINNLLQFCTGRNMEIKYKKETHIKSTRCKKDHLQNKTLRILDTET